MSSLVGAVITCLPSRKTVATIAQREHLVEPMADEQHGHAPVARLADDREQPVDLVRGQRRRGLVEDEDAGLERQRLGDLDQLLVGHRQAADDRRRVDPDVELFEEASASRCIVRQSTVRSAVLRRVADEHVLGDGQVREQPRFLVDDGDAERTGVRRSVEHDRLAVELHRPAVGLMDAGQRLDERALARAVLPNQRVDLAGAQLEGNVVQRLRRRKRFDMSRSATAAATVTDAGLDHPTPSVHRWAPFLPGASASRHVPAADQSAAMSAGARSSVTTASTRPSGRMSRTPHVPLV